MKGITILSLLLLPSIVSFAQSGQSAFKAVYISDVPKPTAPAKLEVRDITFTDRDGNNNSILDAHEKGAIAFEIENNGDGNAYRVEIEVKEINSVKGVQYDRTIQKGDLESKKTTKVVIPINGSADLESSKALYEINVKDANGFSLRAPVRIAFNTQAFKTPQVEIADYTFTNKEKEGKIALGEMVNLKMIIQNKGQGTASDVSMSILNPENVYPAGSTTFSFRSLKPNETQIVNYAFFTNTQYKGTQIPIQVNINESLGKYGVQKTLTISLDQSLAKTLQVEVNAQREENVAISEVSLKSDVDKNIPLNKKKHENRYALIIGNEDYASSQGGIDRESNVDFANNDARIFKEYCTNTMGIPEDNVTFLLNATAGKMSQAVDKLNKLIKVSNGEAEIVVYYAGHGFPDEQTKQAYLIPVDVTAADLQSAYKLQTLYSKLSEFPSKRVTVFLDACFTGGGRNQGLLAARAVKVKPSGDILNGNLVVFTATGSDESSLPWKEKSHGLFTYLLLKNIQQSKGDINYNDLFNKLKNEVSLNAIKVNSKPQTPNLLISNQISDDWKSWKLE